MKDRIKYILGSLIILIAINMIAGLFRDTLDTRYFLRLFEPYRERDAGDWALSEPKTFNYIIGQNGSMVFVRNKTHYYKFSVKRYLNILPDMVLKPELVVTVEKNEK